MKTYLGSAAIIVLMTTGLSAPASAGDARDGLRLSGVTTAWTRMARKSMQRRSMRKGGGTASGTAPNGRNTGMGPTGQPSGVK